MGLMTKRSLADKRRLRRIGVFAVLGLFAWSFIASPNTAPTTAADAADEVEEPATLSAYNAVADAAPVRGLIQHNTYLVSAEPAIARATSEVSLPSQATSTSWLLDFGTVNGLHGTTTGNKVPTETTATQPGGATEEEFSVQRGNVGNEALLRFGAGVVRSSAEHSSRPRGFGYGYLGNIALLPAPGSPEAPPGTYDPASDTEREIEHPNPTVTPTPDDPAAYTPNPRNQMAIVSIGSVASTSETFREDDTAISIAVAELNGISIGNRTADGRCTNCITIDSLRVEARAETNGSKEGARASWRILVHRACRVGSTNDPVTGQAYEGVLCLDPNPDGIIEAFEEQDPDKGEEEIRDPNARGVRKIQTVEELNEQLAELGQMSPVGDIGLTLRIGTEQENTTTISKTYDKATAVARGAVLELRTTALSNGLTQIAASDQAKALIQQIDSACAALAVHNGSIPQPPPVPVAGQVSVGVPAACATGAVQSGQAVRVLRLGFGQVSAAAQAVPGIGGVPADEEPPAPGFPEIQIPTIDIPSFDIPAGGGGGNTYVVGGGLQGGPLKLKIKWSSFKIEPWEPKAMGKSFMFGGLVAGLVLLIRRRLFAT